MGNHHRQDDLKLHYGSTPPKYEKDELLARIADLLRIAESKKDLESVTKLKKLEKSVFVLPSINQKIFNNVNDKLLEIETEYSFNKAIILLKISSLQERAKKVQYEDVLKELEKYRKHITGEEVIKNKTNSDINLKLENVKNEITMIEEFRSNGNKGKDTYQK